MSQPTHAFDIQIRVLECKHCGAPATLELSGDQFACEYCDAVNTYAPRMNAPPPTAAVGQGQPQAHPELEAHLRAAAAIEGRLAAPERIAWVRSEVARPPTSVALDVTASPPSDLTSMAGITSHTTWAHTWLPKLRTHWQQAIPAHERSPRDGAAQHRIYWLAMRLSRAYGVAATNTVAPEEIHQNQLRRRAVLETALQHLEATAYASVLRCRLSRAASHLSDTSSARAWLGACPLDPHDVEVDSELRLAFATIYSREGNATGILGVVGPEGAEVPFRTEDLGAFATAYRIHGYEILGQHDARWRVLRPALKQYGFMRVNGVLRAESIAPGAKRRLFLDFLRASILPS